MSALGELLELLHNAHSRIKTFQIEYRDWSRQRLSNQIVVHESSRGVRQLRWQGGGPWPEETVRTRRIWLERPNRVRVEILEDELMVRLGVRQGMQWWRWDAAEGISDGWFAPDETGVFTVPRMLASPFLAVQRLSADMRLEPAGMSERAGREVACARGYPRRQPAVAAEVVIEFEFDADHGSLLRRARFEDGLCVWERTATEVLYGNQIDPACFVFVAPDEDERLLGTLPVEDQEESDELLAAELEDDERSGSAGTRTGAGATVWLTGIPAAGKTTLGAALEKELSNLGVPACVLDGDVLRRGLSSDLGLSPGDRAEQSRRAGHVAALIAGAGVVAIVALVSPFSEDRRRAREAHLEMGLPFLEVWVDTPLEVCERRDPKGLYARARAGELRGLTGVDAPYEPPEAADLRIEGNAESPEASAHRVVELLTSRLTTGYAAVTPA
jgi:adenylyl-sulfate kinase